MRAIALLTILTLLGGAARGQTNVQFGSQIPYTNPYTAPAPPPTYTAPATAPVLPYTNSPPVWDPYSSTTVTTTTPYVAPPPPVYVAPAPIPAVTAVSPYRTPGFYGAFEAAILEAQVPGTSQSFSVMTPNGTASASASLTPNFSLQFSPRLYVGYRFAQGFGLRAGWWGFDDTGDVNTVFQITLPGPNPINGSVSIGSTLNIDFNVIDALMTQMGTFHNWEYEVFGGVRFASLKYDANIANTISLSSPPITIPLSQAPIHVTSSFDGVGPILGLTARRPVGFWEGLTFVGDARFSLLFGDAESQATAIFAPIVVSGSVFNDTLPVWELRVGAEWSRTLSMGAKFYLGAYLEGQMWDYVPYDTSFNGETGFFGFSLAIGLQR